MNLALAIFWIFLNSVLLIFVFGEFVLMLFAVNNRIRKVKIREADSLEKMSPNDLPKVCIQIPIYNEKYVVERLIDQVMTISYPAEKLVIQILDDSTDESTEIIRKKIKQFQDSAIEIQHLCRESRIGFKAGALAYGLTHTDAEFFAIFDADFIPKKEFLLTTIPHFQDEKIGVVQSRWHHINENESLLTMSEGLMLDVHFGVQQLGRTASSSFINFNGTGGIWRRTCIDDAGGWEGDTITEDLDLSFRAQMKNWKIQYEFDLKSPAELPVTFNAFRNQQYRWSKGAAECVQKNLKNLWKSPVPFIAKWHGSLHLLNSSMYTFMLLIILIGPLIFYFNASDQLWRSQFYWLPIFGLSINGLLLIVLFSGRMLCGKRSLKEILLFFPSVIGFFTFCVGISLHMSVGVIQGYLGIRTEFVRTPKYGEKKNSPLKRLGYRQNAAFDLRIFELIFMFYGLFWMYIGYKNLDILTLFYSFTLIVGFSMSLFFAHKKLSVK